MDDQTQLAALSQPRSLLGIKYYYYFLGGHSVFKITTATKLLVCP